MAPKRRGALGESSSHSSPDLACATLIVKRHRSSRAAERSRKVHLIDEVCKMFPLIWLNVWLISKSG